MDEHDEKPKADGEVAQDAPQAEAAETPKHETKEEPKIEFGAGNENTLMAALSYIGPLILVPFLLGKQDDFVKFHMKQGLLLVIGEVAAWMAAMLFWPLYPLMRIANVFFFVLSIVGIIRSVKGEMKELPLIGHWAKNFKF